MRKGGLDEAQGKNESRVDGGRQDGVGNVGQEQDKGCEGNDEKDDPPQLHQPDNGRWVVLAGQDTAIVQKADKQEEQQGHADAASRQDDGKVGQVGAHHGGIDHETDAHSHRDKGKAQEFVRQEQKASPGPVPTKGVVAGWRLHVKEEQRKHEYEQKGQPHNGVVPSPVDDGRTGYGVVGNGGRHDRFAKHDQNETTQPVLGVLNVDGEQPSSLESVNHDEFRKGFNGGSQPHGGNGKVWKGNPHAEKDSGHQGNDSEMHAESPSSFNVVVDSCEDNKKGDSL